ncbi:MAG TPA: APC family permease, partial [Ktedonobacteraceae bacterium]|nr:APC family permease [Ktedonobacteraceae bacterium]
EDPSLLVRFEERQGTLPGDVRVRMVRPSRNAFRRIDTGMLEATTATEAPRNARERVTQAVKRLVIGAPLSNIQAEHERLSKFKALAVLSSDAISSVAYATEAILLTLLLAHANLTATLPICLAIVALLAIVATSYLQTIPAYPGGGGSYIVAKDNLGTLPGLIAAASLLIDYILTVSVSISAGVQNLVSLFSSLSPYVVLIDVLLVAFITIVNLRGVRESGTIFAIPTYVFIVSALFMIAVGAVRSFLIAGHPMFSPYHGIVQDQPLALFLILKAFAAGCSAMTGVEAISNGVPAFKKPEPRNASITLASMAIILGVLFIGITMLGLSYGIVPNEAGNPTVISQIAANVFNNSPLAFMYPVFTIATLFILTLAANTSYSDFPRLASLLARDDFLPHQFAFRGDRLAFSTGIVFLAVLAGGLLVIFEGDTTKLINLYAVGVFLSFTLSQGGMVLHWWRLRGRQRGWLRSMIINGVGAVTTLLVAAVISSTKFFEGAWIVVILIPILVLAFMGIHKHYHTVEEERTTGTPVRTGDIRHRLIVPIAGLDRVSRQTIAYGRSISSHLTAVHVAIDSADAEKVRERWKEWQDTLPENEKTQLVVIDSPYRSLARPLLAYIDSVHEIYSDDTLTVILPEFVASHWWENILHNQTALQLKAALLFRPGIIVTSVPQHLPGRTKVKHT